MIFNTWLFALFAVVLFALYARVRSLWARNAFLIGAGIVFYVASVPAYILLVLALSVITYACALILVRIAPPRRAARKWTLVLGIAANVGVLGFFKYATLFGTSVGLCHGGCGGVLTHLVVPLAISFFTFEFIHFLIDIYNGKIANFKTIEFFVFALFFPTMVAGPIKRFQNFAPQLRRFAHVHSLQVAAGVYRVLLGLAKKSIIADSMTPLTQPLLSPGPLYASGDYWIAAFAYSAKIYFDFTGYSDIAIGLAELLGFRIVENFDRPYWARNISNFWQRWHISLSSWIRDYLFIPLGGSRRNLLRTLFNLTLVMAIAGLWHGANWHFVVWGLFQGAGLALHRAYSLIVPKALLTRWGSSSALNYASVAVTFLFVTLGWVLFASPSLATAGTVYRHLLSIGQP